MSKALVKQQNAITPREEGLFEQLVTAVKNSVASTTFRVYEQTYRLWVDFCYNTDKQPLIFYPEKLMDFLKAQHVTMRTRKRQLSALRKLMGLYLLATDDVGTLKTIQYLKEFVKKLPDENTSKAERSRKSMSPSEVHRIMTSWDNTPIPRYTALYLRNRALIRLLFASGIRRAEAATLLWDDLDLDNGTAHISHGKGDKARDVAIVGSMAIAALKDWREMVPAYRHVFVNFDQKQRIVQDQPISGHTVWRVIQQTEKMTGLTFTPHTARRTFITEALQSSPVPDVQAQAGHASGNTTLMYAQAADAVERRKKFSKMRYGD